MQLLIYHMSLQRIILTGLTLGPCALSKNTATIKVQTGTE